MSFNSYDFLLYFLPIVLVGYYLLYKTANKKLLFFWLTIASLFFYGVNNFKVLFILFISLIVNFIVSKGIIKYKNQKYSKIIFISGILFNILFLCFFKYFNFININIFRTSLDIKNIIFPLGISFITFQQISLISDIYTGIISEITLLPYLFYITFFPKVISGPLASYSSLTEEVKKDHVANVDFSNISKGIFLFSIGLFKKVIIADTIALIATNGFDLSTNLNFIEAWITALSYTLQIYFDFSGYSDMAIGIASMFNISLPINFDTPYKSSSIKEFWQRWHITLGSFFTKYVYFPLGGSRKGTSRTYLNLFIIFLISGLWHGTGLTFLIWGVLHGIARVINQIFIDNKIKINKYLAIFITFNFVNIAWIFFRSNDLSTAFKVLKGMVNISSLNELIPLFTENYSIFMIIISIFIFGVILSNAYKITNDLFSNILKSFCVLIIFILCFRFYVKCDFEFVKIYLTNLDYSYDLITALKISILAFILICIDTKNIISLEKFKPTFINLILASVLAYASIINFNKISDFIYKSF